MTFTLKTDAVTAALDAAIAAKGEDYHYKGMTPVTNRYLGATCVYAEADGSPSCIVGHVVAALEPELFRQMHEAEEGEGFPVTELETGLAVTRYDEDDRPLQETVIERVKADNEALYEALRVAQSLQDQGYSWGEAGEAYHRTISGEDSYEVEREIKARYGK
jgi:hypothetical protein